jgi:hypothetical protein
LHGVFLHIDRVFLWCHDGLLHNYTQGNERAALHADSYRRRRHAFLYGAAPALRPRVFASHPIRRIGNFPIKE